MELLENMAVRTVHQTLFPKKKPRADPWLIRFLTHDPSGYVL